MAVEWRRIIFTGHVQGVGFRWTTSRIAGGYDVAGFVRNLPDRSVELVAEGEQVKLDEFLAEIDGNLGWCIRSRTVQSSPPTHQFTSFAIRH